MTRRSRPKPASVQWRQQIDPLLVIFAERLQESPMLKFENAHAVATELEALYTRIQQIPCPEDADDIYKHVTSAILNLFMCYQSVADFQWDKAEAFYGRATSEWTRAKGLLFEYGLRRVAV